MSLINELKIEITILIISLITLIGLIITAVYVWKNYKEYIQQLMDENGNF